MQAIDRIDLGDAKRLDLGLFDPLCQGSGWRGIARVEREQDLRKPAAAQLGTAVRAVAGFLATRAFASRGERPQSSSSRGVTTLRRYMKSASLPQTLQRPNRPDAIAPR